MKNPMTHFETIKMQVNEMVATASFALPWKLPISVVSGILAYLIGVENYASLVVIVVLMIFDLVTAIMAAYKQGDPIESRRALKSATKLTVYCIFLSAMHLTESVIPGTTFMDEVTASFLALTEAISIMENIGKMGFAVPLKLLNRLKELQETK